MIFTQNVFQSNEGEWWSASTSKQPASLLPPSILRSSSSEKEEKEEKEKQSSLLPPSILRLSPHSSTDDPKPEFSSNAKEKEEVKVEKEASLKAEKLDTEVCLSHFTFNSFDMCVDIRRDHVMIMTNVIQCFMKNLIR